MSVCASATASVVVTGAIGVGKTTWSSALAEYFGATHLPEHDESNNFFRVQLDRGAEEVSSFLPQMFYYISAANQQVDLGHNAGLTFQDSSALDVHMVWSRLLLEQARLSDSEFDALQITHARACELVAKPTLVIYLRPSVDATLERIESRGRPFERHWTGAQISRMIELRDELWEETADNVLTIDNGDLPHPSEQLSPSVIASISEIVG